MRAAPAPGPIGPIWQRPVALLVDISILALAGALIGAFFGSQLIAVGPWGRLIELGIALGVVPPVVEFG